MNDNTRKLVDEVESWLSDPMDSGLDEALEQAETLQTRLREALKEHPESGSTLGPLVARVNGLQKRLQNLEILDWVPAGGGKLAIGHRPGSTLMTDIQLQGGTHILTLLSESESAEQIGKEARNEGLEWLWFGMSSATPPGKGRLPEVKALFSEITQALDQDARIYIHCSAGIHRTGMISYAFLRYLGLSAAEAKKKLEELRPTTREGVGEERLEWGEQFGSDSISDNNSD